MRQLKFRNGRFRILQISDMQEIANTSPDTVNLTDLIIMKTKPDLIVLTGDQVKGYGITMKPGDSKTKAAQTLTNLLKPITSSKIPFTAVYGNHDIFEEADEEFQWQCYKLYDNFVGTSYNFDSLPIYNEKDEPVFCVYLFNSGIKNKGKYTPVSDDLLSKYIAVRDTFKVQYGKYIPAIAFQHIPPYDVYDCLRQVKKGTKHSYAGIGKNKNTYYTLPDYAKNHESFIGENAASPEESGNEIAVLSEKGDVLGLFFGHDHNNSFIVNNGKIDLGYTQGIGYTIYGPGKNRGARVFDIYENKPNKYKTFTVTAKDFPHFKLERPIIEFLYTHSPTSVTEAKKVIGRSFAIIGATAAAITILKKILR